MRYSEVPIIIPMVLVEFGLNKEQVSLILMRPIHFKNCILVLKQVVLISRVVLIMSGLNCGTLLYIYLEMYYVINLLVSK